MTKDKTTHLFFSLLHSVFNLRPDFWKTMFFINQRLSQGYIFNRSRVRGDGLVEAVPADLAITAHMKPPPMQHGNQRQNLGWTHAEHLLNLDSSDA